MNNVNHLVEVITAEAELTEQLVDAMRRQQAALVRTDSVAIEAETEKQEELLLPIEGFEQERVRLTRAVWNEISNKTAHDGDIHLSQLISELKGDDAGKLASAGDRLRRAVEQTMKLRQANEYLLDHSRKFVHETLKIVSNGYSRQLIDQKM